MRTKCGGVVESVSALACDCTERCRLFAGAIAREDCIYSAPGVVKIAYCDACEKFTFQENGACVDCFEKWALAELAERERVATNGPDGAKEAPCD